MATYQQKLRLPEWQKKRLEIMIRDGFKCRECGDAKSTLNVDHGYYEKDRMPWEYPDESLRTLCEDCHGKIEELRKQIKKAMGALDLRGLNRALGSILHGSHEPMPPAPSTQREFVMAKLRETTDHETAIGLLRQLQTRG